VPSAHEAQEVSTKSEGTAQQAVARLKGKDGVTIEGRGGGSRMSGNTATPGVAIAVGVA
jgi:hypothetical protein